MAIRKLKTCLALLAVSGVLAAAAEEAPKNLLMNSDFQTATQPGYPDFWDGASGWLPGTHALLDGGFIPGTRTLRLTAKNKRRSSSSAVISAGRPAKRERLILSRCI